MKIKRHRAHTNGVLCFFYWYRGKGRLSLDMKNNQKYAAP